MITYSLGDSERGDTKDDTLAFGFVTSSAEDAVLLRVVSGNSNDFLLVQLVLEQLNFLFFIVWLRSLNERSLTIKQLNLSFT